MDETYKVGDYVRSATKDMGTGAVVEVVHRDWVSWPSRIVQSEVLLAVAWLDKEGVPVEGPLKPTDVRRSSRGMPDFTTVEEAEEWMRQQTSGGNWLDSVEDFATTAAESVEEEIEEVVRGALAVPCGSTGNPPPHGLESCTCMECMFEAGQHFEPHGCECRANNCGCLYQDGKGDL